jgi:diadenylate cyclase
MSSFQFSPALWVDFTIAALFLFSLSFYIFFFIRRKLYSIPFFFLSILTLINYYFLQFSLLTMTSFFFLLVLSITFMLVNLTELKARIDGIFRHRGQHASGVSYDKEMIYDILFDAVASLAKTRTGALITLERGISLTELTKNGTILNAPLNSELITTIFYKGTRLHDGAIIIRGSVILAASVYYTPTTKPLVIKHGSRHRAAIGISEISDAVTIVVSEETGRISIAYGGELESVYIDSFKKVLSNYMENRPTLD